MRITHGDMAQPIAAQELTGSSVSYIWKGGPRVHRVGWSAILSPSSPCPMTSGVMDSPAKVPRCGCIIAPVVGTELPPRGNAGQTARTAGEFPGAAATIMQWCMPPLRQHAGTADASAPVNAEANTGRPSAATNTMEKMRRICKQSTATAAKGRER